MGYVSFREGKSNVVFISWIQNRGRISRYFYSPFPRTYPWDWLYLPTFAIKINYPCRYIYQSHGSVMGYKDPILPHVITKIKQMLVDILGCPPSQ